MSERDRDRGKHRAGYHWDFDWLRFGGGKISPTDVDALFFVERRGRFLFIETKTDDEELPDGQKIALQALSKVPGFTVIIVRGPKGFPKLVQTVTRGVWSTPGPSSREDVQTRVDKWYKLANESPAINRADAKWINDTERQPNMSQ
jgi:hypothetical protein